MPYVYNPFTENLDNTGSGGGGGSVNSVSGTANRITSTGGTDPIIDIAATYVGQTSLTTLGTISTGTWNGTAVDETHGGTAQTTYATGDTIYASGANTLAKRTIGSTGNVLTVSGGVPTWAAPGNPTMSTAFWANTSGDLSNVTGDGTSYAVVFDNLTYGQNGSAYNTGTGIFTAPVTGWYMFTYAMCLSNVDGSHTDCNCDLETTDTYGLIYRSISNPAALKDPAGNVTVYDSRVVHLAATNTIKVVVTVYSGTKTVGLLGPQSTVQMYTSFGGTLISL